MLRRISPREREGDWVSMKDAAYPVPFAHGLEYNSPAHGPWNIVHTGMLIPGAHQIYVCGANCVRGVVLTAAEMNASDRFSTLSIEEEDLYSGMIEENLIEGVVEILHKLPYKPSAVLLFTVCVHHFMGCDIPYIYEELRRRMPDYIFVECYMDPIMQKEGLTPDQKLRAAMLSFLPKTEKKEKQISFLGSDFPLEEDSEILEMIRKAGWVCKNSASCQNFEEYLALSESSLAIVTYPMARYGVGRYAAEHKTASLYLPLTFSYEKISEQMESLARAMGISSIASYLDFDALIKCCENKASELLALVKDTEIAIDMNALPSYLGLARFLIEHGFHVTRIYGDAFSDEEEDYLWLKEHAPDIKIYPTIQARMRVLHGSCGLKVLAVGQKAAYFTGSPYFVNMVEGLGYHGIRGICHLLDDMKEAFLNEKDLTMISHKGLGCECCL